MKIQATKLSYNNNVNTYYSVDGSDAIHEPGAKDIDLEIEFIPTSNDISKLSSRTPMNLSVDVSSEDCYIAKDCLVSSFDINGDANGNYTCHATFKVKSLEHFPPVKFTDGNHKVSYEDYCNIKEYYGLPENMSYEEFKDKLFVEEL